MYCQLACPANKRSFLWFEEKGSFTEEETELILKGTSPKQLPHATVEKLEKLYLLDQMDVIPRNLDVLIKQGSQFPAPLSEDKSYVKRGDRVIEPLGEEDEEV